MLRLVCFRIVAIALGFCLVVLAIEACLRIGSAVLGSHDPSAPQIVADGEIRITCLGESTTRGKWPAQLENLLNDSVGAPRFRVINRGIVGIRTDGIADRVEGWLDEDRPHVVITMLGINDEGNVLVYPRDEKQSWLVEHMMTARLLDLLWRSFSDQDEPAVSTLPEEAPGAEAHWDAKTRSMIEHLANRRPEAHQRFRDSEMIEIQRDLLIVDPGSPVYHLGYLVGMVLYHESEERIEAFFRNEIGLDPTGLTDEGRHRLVTEWMEGDGDRFAGIRLSASMAARNHELDLERSHLETTTDDPVLEGLLELRLAELAFRTRSPGDVRTHIRRADIVLPDDYAWSLLLGAIGFRLEAFDLAAEQFERALRLRPDLPPSHETVLLGRLANAYDQAGDDEQAARTRTELEELELGRFREFTRHHYRRVVDAVRAREIPVIVMQYPMLPVSSLRKILDDRDDVIYLENRENFEKAVRELGYRSLFGDHFAGSFGHFTPRGDMLVAHNVAEAVLALTGHPQPEPTRADAP